MQNFSGPGRRDVPLISDASLAALLAGAPLPPGSAPELRPVAEALAELTGRPAEGELDGEAETLAAFRHQFSGPGPARHAARQGRPRPRPRPLAAIAAVAAATILGFGGVAMAAFAGALPGGLQRLAHDIIGAPTASAQPAANSSPLLPAAPGQHGLGLCTAWRRAKMHGTHKQQAAAFRELAVAAGGASPAKVTAYCNAVMRLGTPPPHRPRPPGHSGNPAGSPKRHGSGKPTALPSPHGSGKPTALPTPRGAGAAHTGGRA
jgi:hypothetical protein